MKYIKPLIFLVTLILQISSAVAAQKVVIAIDAGHGGKDSGAIGATRLFEKNVTIAISRKVFNLLNKDPLFTPVLTRNSDVFISVPVRSEIARRHKANLLVSIHADAAPNRRATGASVWVLSIERADTELGRWLEAHEKQSELLGGAGDVLSGDDNPFLSQAILDLQFAHSQRVGYELAQSILKNMHSTISIHKKDPEHASLGVLRSPDIPSVLVEVGFISNQKEEKLLRSTAYQNKIAQSIYKGIKEYVKRNPVIGEN